MIPQDMDPRLQYLHTRPATVPHKCPVCDGSGLVSRPTYVAGDVYGYTTSSTGPFPCNACAGSGIVWGPA